MTPLELGESFERSITAVTNAIDTARKEAIREVGAVARAEHLAVADEAPGADRKFSGTDKFNGGRLGVKIRYEYREALVRISPSGPWGLPAGKRRSKPGLKSWDKGEAATARKADVIVPKTIDTRVQEAYRRA